MAAEMKKYLMNYIYKILPEFSASSSLTRARAAQYLSSVGDFLSCLWKAPETVYCTSDTSSDSFGVPRMVTPQKLLKKQLWNCCISSSTCWTSFPNFVHLMNWENICCPSILRHLSIRICSSSIIIVTVIRWLHLVSTLMASEGWECDLVIALLILTWYY